MKEKIKKWFNKLKEKGFVLKLSIVPFLCGMMYAIAGSDHTPKQVRRFGIPVLLTLFVWLSLKNIWALTCFFSFISFSIGHGIPCATDEGSTLGRFYYNLFNQNHLIADYLTRGTKALIFCLSFLSIPILKSSLIVYSILSTILIIMIASIAWRDFGKKVVNIGKKSYTVLYVDIATGTLFGLYVIGLLKF